MKSLILIHSNPESRAIWDGMPESERAEGWRAYAELTEDLAASGELPPRMEDLLRSWRRRSSAASRGATATSRPARTRSRRPCWRPPRSGSPTGCPTIRGPG